MINTTVILAIKIVITIYLSNYLTGSTCSAAEQASSDNWFNELDRNYSKYCNCNSGSWELFISSTSPCNSQEEIIYSMSFRYDYTNECSSSKTATITATDGGRILGSTEVSIGSGSGSGTSSIYWGGSGAQCGDVMIQGDNGNC